MIVGVPKEIKDNESRIAMTPAGVYELTRRKHKVLVQKNGGIGSGFTDEQYVEVGATVIETPKEIFEKADMIVKVKEPMKAEYNLLRENQLLFTYLHLAADKECTKMLVDNKVAGIAYETVNVNGFLPLLAPMSEVAGRMATFVAAQYLRTPNQGKGILMCGVPGTKSAKVVVVGGGFVGANAARIAYGVGAEVTILDVNVNRVRELVNLFPKARILVSNQKTIEEEVKTADAVIGAVLLTGAAAPKLITHAMAEGMEDGSVIVDVSIDQGGCCTFSKPTTHSNPVFDVAGVTCYCVANMPGAYPRTSTIALTNSTLPYVLRLADEGVGVLKKDPAFLEGLNTYKGKLVYKAVAAAHKMDYTDPKTLL